MKRASAAIVLLLALAGCALPKLPSLPSLTDIKEASGLVSAGSTAKDAVALAGPVADAWATDAVLVDVRGTRIDSGGRDQGNRDGQWLVSFQSKQKAKGHGVVVVNKQVKGQQDGQYTDGAATLDRGLAGVLDSPDAAAKAGLGDHTYTLVLRGDAQGPRYDVLVDGAGNSVTLDARSGAKVSP